MWSLLGFYDENDPNCTIPKHTSLNEDAEVDNMKEEEALECDYERDCTNLYKKIEEEDWMSIHKFLETGYWPGHFFADPVPPADQVRSWVTRFSPECENGVRWSQLPLHLAIVVEAPYAVVGSLIKLYPQAVRCTDDQHMLPLHLAMRHGASDGVVDLLLAAFPEAVNAKGRNDRTPLECGIRGPNKIRARILRTFVERARSKAARSAFASYSREVATIRSKLEDNHSEHCEIKSMMATVDTAKEALQLELDRQKDLSSSSNVGVQGDDTSDGAQSEIRSKIAQLEQEEARLEKAQKRVSEEEEKLIYELERVQLQVAKTASPEDLLALKEEIEAMKKNRLRTQENETNELEEMKRHLAEALSRADDATRDLERQANLRRAATTDGAGTTEVATLKGEVEGLRQELKRKDEAGKIKSEVSILRESLETELQESSETMTQEQLAAVTKAISSVRIADLDNKTAEELKSLKEELEVLLSEVRERRLPDKMTEDVIELRRRMDEVGGRVTDNETKKALSGIKKQLDAIKVAKLQTAGNEELLALNANLFTLREQLKDTEDVAKMRDELAELKKDLEAEVKQAGGVKRRGANKDSRIVEFKAAIQKLGKLEKKSKFDLISLKFELEDMQNQIRFKKIAQDIKQDVASVMAQVDKLLQTATGKTNDELISIKTSLEAIDINQIGTNGQKEANNASAEISKEKRRLAEQKLAMRLKTELQESRQNFSAEVARRQDREEAVDPALKDALTKLSDEELDKMTTLELRSTKQQLSWLKKELQEKEQVMEDIDEMKTMLDELLQKKEGAVKDDLEMMKKTVDAIDLQDLDIKNGKEWADLKSQVEFLKKELEDADIVEKTKQDLLNLKEAVDATIAESEGSTKAELLRIQKTVNAIDVGSMDSSKPEEWKTLKAELAGLKKDLKAKECESLTEKIRGKLKHARNVSKVEISRITRRLETIDNSYSDKHISNWSIQRRCWIQSWPIYPRLALQQ